MLLEVVGSRSTRREHAQTRQEHANSHQDSDLLAVTAPNVCELRVGTYFPSFVAITIDASVFLNEALIESPLDTDIPKQEQEHRTSRPF